MTSMAAALAASLPAPAQRVSTPDKPISTKVPQRLEGVVDPEAQREVESVNLNSLALLKILKHSTDSLPHPPQASYTDRAAPPHTQLSSHTDAVGVLLGLDFDGVLEVEDCYALPVGESSVGPNSYTANILTQLREVQIPDSPIGIYLSTHSSTTVTKQTIELLIAVERLTARGKAVLVVHDAAKSKGGDLSVKAWRLSDGAKEAAISRKWDTGSLIENRITPSNIVTPLPITISSSSLISAFLQSLTQPSTPPAKPSLTSPSVPLPPSFAALSNPLASSLPSYLSDTLDSITLYNHEANNVAFLVRQMAREKAKHESAVKEREDENVRRKKQGLSELPGIAEMRGGTKDPSRLDMLIIQGQTEGLAKGMGSEAGKGLVRCYL